MKHGLLGLLRHRHQTPIVLYTRQHVTVRRGWMDFSQPQLETADDRRPSCTPRWPASTRTKVMKLASALQPDSRVEATEALRGLVDAIILTAAAEGKALAIELQGNLAAMLGAAQRATRSPETGDLELRMAIGCGGAQRARFLLRADRDGGVVRGLELVVAGDGAEHVRARRAEGHLGRERHRLAVHGQYTWRVDRHLALTAVVHPANPDTWLALPPRLNLLRTEIRGRLIARERR